VVADRDPDVVTHRVVLAGSILHQHTTNLGLTISKKSCLVPNSAVSLSAAASLRALGVPIFPAASAEDLGIQCVGGRRRVAAKTAERMHKASLRAIRNGILVRKVGAAARKLTRSGVIPQQSYGFEAHGLSESQIQNMRSNIARSLGNAPSGSCARTFIAQSNTDITDPAVSYAVAQVGIWIDMWTSASAEQKATIKAAWPRALQMTCKTPPQHWIRHVKGPLTATVVILRMQGWSPKLPDDWYHPDHGVRAVLGYKPHTRHAVLELIKNCAERRVWHQASFHCAGGGLEKGPPWISEVTRVRAWMHKHGHTAQASALTAVVSGAVWVGERFAPVDDHLNVDLDTLPATAFCRHCGEYETLFHRFWTCSRHQVTTCPHVKSSNKLLPRAREGEGNECLWLRGLTPHDVWTYGPDVPSLDVKPSLVFGRDVFTHPLAVFGSDGAGGPKTIHELLRRVAAAFIGRLPDGTLCGLASDVPGRQTVPRAETWAFLCLLRVRPHPLSIELWVDASYVLNGYLAWATPHQDGYACGANGDIWSQVYEDLDSRAASCDVGGVKDIITLRKVKSHVSLDEAIARGATHLGWTLNALADTLVDARAAYNQVNSIYRRYIGYAASTSFSVLRRLAFIEADVRASSPTTVTRPPTVTVDPLPDTAITKANTLKRMRDMGHHTVTHGQRTTCTRCRASRGINWSGWDRLVCGPAPVAKQGRLASPPPFYHGLADVRPQAFPPHEGSH
jgi:hypothetical protein